MAIYIYIYIVFESGNETNTSKTIFFFILYRYRGNYMFFLDYKESISIINKGVTYFLTVFRYP